METSTLGRGGSLFASQARELGNPSISIVSPLRYAWIVVRACSSSSTWVGWRPIWRRAESPRPIPRTARPWLSAWSVAAAEAVTAGWRVAGLVTPGPSLRVVVAAAASASSTQSSAVRFWLSASRSPSKPRASAARAVSAMRPGKAKAWRKTSIRGAYVGGAAV